MRRTLFHIPHDLFGIPLLGVGLLLALWGIFCGVWFVRWYLRGGEKDALSSFAVTAAIVGVMITWVGPFLEEGGSGLPIRGYGVMMLIAIVSAVWLAIQRGNRRGLTADTLISLGTWLMVGGILGARAFYVIEYAESYRGTNLLDAVVKILNFTSGGLVVFGGLIGAAVAFLIFCARHRLPPLALADVIAPSLALGQAVGRVGCFLSGCCFAGPSDLPWAVAFPWGSEPHRHQVQTGEVYLHGMKFLPGPQAAAAEDRPTVSHVEPGSLAERNGIEPGDVIVAIGNYAVTNRWQAEDVLLHAVAPGGVVELHVAGKSSPIRWSVPSVLPRSSPAHPVQIYSALDAFLLCGFLLAYTPLARRDGELVAWLLTLHPISRFLLEQIRVDEPGIVGTGLSISQIISVALFCSGIALWAFVLSRSPGKVSFETSPSIARRDPPRPVATRKTAPKTKEKTSISAR